jgi:hypothetical protein
MARNFTGTPGLIIDNVFASTWVNTSNEMQVNTLDRSVAKSVVITKVSSDTYVAVNGLFATTMADGSADIIRVKNWVEFPKAELAQAIAGAVATEQVWEAGLPVGQNQTADCRIIALQPEKAAEWGVDLTEATLTNADGSTETVKGFIALTTSAYLSLLEGSLRNLKPVGKANKGGANNAFDRTQIAEVLPQLKDRRHMAVYVNTDTGQMVKLLATPRGTQRIAASAEAKQARIAGTIYESASAIPVEDAPAAEATPLRNRVAGWRRS